MLDSNKSTPNTFPSTTTLLSSPNNVFIFIGDDNNTLPLLVTADKEANNLGYNAGMIMRKVSSFLGGSGGGRPDFASGAGKDKSKINELLNNVKDMLK